jgi:hypothetical protein
VTVGADVQGRGELKRRTREEMCGAVDDALAELEGEV